MSSFSAKVYHIRARAGDDCSEAQRSGVLELARMAEFKVLETNEEQIKKGGHGRLTKAQ
jgi:hypothetical protein